MVTRMPRPVCAAFVVAFFALVASACGGSDVRQTTGGADSKVAEAPEGPSNEDVRDYLANIFSGDLAKKKAALVQAQEGSVAHAYAYHQMQVAQAQVDGGEDLGEPETVTESDGAFRVCEKGKSSDDACSTYGDVKAQGSKIVSFTIDGNSLPERISIGNGRKFKAGSLGTVKLLSAYQTISRGMFIVVEAQSGPDKVTIDAAPKYRGANGRQAIAGGVSGVTDLDADSTTNLAMVFENAEAGGTLTLTMMDADYGNPQEVKIKTR
jgi:hypothetical protein